MATANGEHLDSDTLENLKERLETTRAHKETTQVRPTCFMHGQCQVVRQSGSQSRIEFLDTMNALSATLLPRIGVYLLVEFAQLGRRGMYGHLVIDMA